jgi:hypothetical protein
MTPTVVATLRRGAVPARSAPFGEGFVRDDAAIARLPPGARGSLVSPGDCAAWRSTCAPCGAAERRTAAPAGDAPTVLLTTLYITII